MYAISRGSRRGMGLLELLIGAVIASGLMLGLNTVYKTSAQIRRGAELNSDILDLYYQISLVLSNTERCQYALGGQTLTTTATPAVIFVPDTTQSITNLGRTVLLDTASHNQVGNLKVTSITIREVGTPGLRSLAELAVTYASPKVGLLGGLATKTFHFSAELSPANKITACESKTSVKESCDMLGGTFVATTGLCQMKGCTAPGTFLAGYSSDGNPICNPPYVATTCPFGQYIVGLNGGLPTDPPGSPFVPVCQPIPIAHCRNIPASSFQTPPLPGAQLVKGIASDGSVICGERP